MHQLGAFCYNFPILAPFEAPAKDFKAPNPLSPNTFSVFFFFFFYLIRLSRVVEEGVGSLMHTCVWRLGDTHFARSPGVLPEKTCLEGRFFAGFCFPLQTEFKFLPESA